MTRLDATGLVKSYAGVTALDRVDFDVAAGEIHALVGENGAGKSTLIKILSGAVKPDAGSVRLDGTPLPAGDPRAVRRRGISVVYQEFTLVPELSLADNVFLGRERGRVFVDRAAMARETTRVLAELGVRLDASARVAGLSVAQQQMIEIARALVTEAKVLILDEPTATLAAADVERLFSAVRRLAARGLAIVYISHRLEEVFSLAGRVTVLRDGRRVASGQPRALTRADLIRAMVGRDVSEEFPPRTTTPGEPVLTVRNLAAPPRIAGASLSVRRGEIVGLAGLVGAGRTSVALALVGAIASSGEVALDGARVRFRSPADAIARGLAYLTEDRKALGLFPLMGTGENITLTFLRAFASMGLVRVARERQAAAESARRFDVRAAGLAQPAGTLSGGNQQKVLLARFLLRPRVLIILDEPTRGVDVGARAEIYGLMNQLTAEGLAILMISSDLPEVLGISDRIVVMRNGATAGELVRRDATAERVMSLAAL